MPKWLQGRAIALVLVGLAVIGVTSVSLPQVARADPDCVNGAYLIFARGSNAGWDSDEARAFKREMTGTLSVRGVNRIAWAELGNLNGDYDPQDKLDAGEYPAVRVDDWRHPPFNYGSSVQTGTDELIRHLNDRVMRCPNEAIIIGGYSQGADVVGWALERDGWGSLSQAARDHIAFVGLYGSPRFNCYQMSARGISCPPNIVGTTLTPRTIPSYFLGRTADWCDLGDNICTGRVIINGGNVGNHGEVYQNSVIAASAHQMVLNSLIKLDDLHILSLMPDIRYQYLAELAQLTDTPVPPALPVITHIKRTAGPDGVREVYASTKSSVTEAWWYPGGDGVHTDEIIHISQDNIVGFDKVNEPDGTTQSLYTAVPDGVWETWWRPGEGVHHNKIVTGLSGVRQVIADPDQESAGYTHRLYLLAQDGPYEVWWRDGGDGIHVNRLDIVNDPVTMTKSKGPDGADQLYVATPTWVYELWWRPGENSVHNGSIINIAQGDIRSLDKDLFGANGQLLYTGTSTSVWQSYWTPGSGLETHMAMWSQVNAIQVKKTNYNGVHELYLATGDHVQEYWWRDDGSNGTSTLIDISQNNITSFDKSSDGADQQVYTASGDLVYETWWRAGNGPNTHVLFKVAR